MPMQVFEFQADSSVSLASTAAINRKSCDHCFLNRKTCDKVRTPTDTGDKCRRCAKDDRPCTFTPTVHLYHIADCVGRHQCRAKVIQAMGGRKKEIKFKTIEIPIVCDMDSELDQALYDYIQKQPNLLVYNNRIKSFLAQDMLGLTEEQEDRMSTQNDQGVPDVSSESPTHGSKRCFEADDGNSRDTAGDTSLASPTQGPHKFRIMALIDAHQSQSQQQRQQQQQQNITAPTEEQERQLPHAGKSPRVTPIDMTRLNAMPVSPNSLSPIDAMNALQRRLSDSLAASQSAMLAAQQGQAMQLHQSQQLSYSQTSNQQQQQRQAMQDGYRSSSPMPHSPLLPSPTRHSPQPPSPLELSLNIHTNFSSLSSSHHNLPSLFNDSLIMSTQQQYQQQTQQTPTRTSIGTSTSPQLGSESTVSNTAAPPLVITTTNEDGNEVGFYYAVPSVNLNPAYSDADLFQDFTMLDDALGENFVWIENLFDDPTPEEAAANMDAMSVAAVSGSLSLSPPSNGNTSSDLINNADVSSMSNLDMMNSSNDVVMGSAMLSQHQPQPWMAQGFAQSL
ncbi:hypothetical protein EDD11_009238 [Mortierella claussenii]|nr:hypothetical protein EDD11_009238 [Mortierella claussenii]